MSPQRLLHHLRRHRKGAGLSQRELARLLGWSSAEKISRYEHFHSVPSLKTAIAYEVVFGTPLRKLLPGLYARIKKQVAFQADLLLVRGKTSVLPHHKTKRAFLQALAQGASDDPRPA